MTLLCFVHVCVCMCMFVSHTKNLTNFLNLIFQKRKPRGKRNHVVRKTLTPEICKKFLEPPTLLRATPNMMRGIILANNPIAGVVGEAMSSFASSVPGVSYYILTLC